MSVRRLDAEQPESFAFSQENEAWAGAQLKKYPKGKQASAVIPLLWRAQEQAGGWVPEPAIRYVAALLDMPRIRVLEIATFYTMFNLAPVGAYFVQLCGTTPCWLRGADGLKDVCRRVIGEPGRVREDGKFSWLEVECLGACVNGPMVQINADYYEDLTPEILEALLNDLAEGRGVKPGPQVERTNSCPMGGPTTLLNGGGRPSESVRAGRVQSKPKPKSKPKPRSNPKTKSNPKSKPKALRQARKGGPDRLSKISGIGPKIENQLNGLGIFHFDQVAAWSKANAAWLDEQLSFKGRIEREEWIAQAKAQTKGKGS